MSAGLRATASPCSADGSSTGIVVRDNGEPWKAGAEHPQSYCGFAVVYSYLQIFLTVGKGGRAQLLLSKTVEYFFLVSSKTVIFSKTQQIFKFYILPVTRSKLLLRIFARNIMYNDYIKVPPVAAAPSSVSFSSALPCQQAAGL